jgi:hypothetical protein
MHQIKHPRPPPPSCPHIRFLGRALDPLRVCLALLARGLALALDGLDRGKFATRTLQRTAEFYNFSVLGLGPNAAAAAADAAAVLGERRCEALAEGLDLAGNCLHLGRARLDRSLPRSEILGRDRERRVQLRKFRVHDAVKQ